MFLLPDCLINKAGAGIFQYPMALLRIGKLIKHPLNRRGLRFLAEPSFFHWLERSSPFELRSSNILLHYALLAYAIPSACLRRLPQHQVTYSVITVVR